VFVPRIAIPVLVAALLGLTVPLDAAAPPALRNIIASAVADPGRPSGDRDADALRKPADTLAFSGVRPRMAVGEFYPGGGYFTRLLSDVVGPAGHVYGLENRGWGDAVKIDRELIAHGKMPNVSMNDLPFGQVSFPVPLDLAWVTQNYHDLKVRQFGTVDTLAFDRAVYKALKPGGIFFILDHQGWSGMSADDIAKVHRVDREVVIKEVTAAGFKLVGEGNFLRRPSDDHRRPIFDAAVKGHTDQFALKFIKPEAR
jgi:predicted methyltransferase